MPIRIHSGDKSYYVQVNGVNCHLSAKDIDVMQRLASASKKREKKRVDFYFSFDFDDWNQNTDRLFIVTKQNRAQFQF